MNEFNPLICGLCLLEVEKCHKSECFISGNAELGIIVTELFGDRVSSGISVYSQVLIHVHIPQ